MSCFIYFKNEETGIEWKIIKDWRIWNIKKISIIFKKNIFSNKRIYIWIRLYGLSKSYFIETDWALERWNNNGFLVTMRNVEKAFNL